MSSDGAQLGVSAERALDTILGGAAPPTEEESVSAEEMRAQILASTEAGATTYDGTALYTAKLVLEWLLADPTRAQGPVENEYAKNADGTYYGTVAMAGWYDRMKADGIDLAALGLSGFMWGWAVNAARRCVELPEVSNPALITITTED